MKGEDGGGDGDLGFHGLIGAEFARRHRLRNLIRLPLPLEEAIGPSRTVPREVGLRADVVDLEGDGSWAEFSQRFTTGKKTNLKPWYRCMGLLRGLGCVTAVIEQFYVCLDYRSEFAAFYAHLHAPRRNATVRLHFFSESVAADEVPELSRKQRDSYLGYIICREGDMPLVGRTVLKAPSYITVSTAVREPVHFYGQDLTVDGVPFMQQDERFAVCAHIAAWATHYTGFRRGLFERKLIADFVYANAHHLPMRSRMPEGLTTTEAVGLLDHVGFRSLSYGSNLAMDPLRLPSTTLAQLPVLADHLPALRDASPNEDVSGRVTLAYDEVLDELTERAQAGGDDAPDPTVEPAESPLDSPAIRAMDALLFDAIAPYLASGWPVYAGTVDHAMILCGYDAPRAERPVYFVHDDQIGPYLAAPSLAFLSKSALRYQSGRYADRALKELNDEPPVDLVRAGIEQRTLGPRLEDDHERTVVSVVIPLPQRVHLPLAVARCEAAQMVSDLSHQEAWALLAEADRQALEQSVAVVKLMKGTRYKSVRRKQFLKQKDTVAAKVFGSAQFAEWVVLVEGTYGRHVVWEAVFDASSSEDSPRLDLLRVARSVLVAAPEVEPALEADELGSWRVSPVPQYRGRG